MLTTPRRDLAACAPAKPLFLVHKQWTDSFFSSQPTRKICNAPLVDQTRGCHQCRQVVLRQDLQQDRDFVVVGADQWARLCDDYGADYEICRFRTATKPSVACGSAVKGESIKAKAGATKKKTTTANNKAALSKATARADTLRHKLTDDAASSLVLFPEQVALHYVDPEAADAANTDDAIIPCYHSVCGHAVRIPLSHGSSVAMLGELARQEITRCTDLDLATYEWLLPTSHRGHRFDYLYYDRKLELWTPGRKPGAQSAFPADLTRMVSSEDAELKLCVRKRMTRLELDECAAAVTMAENALCTKEKLQRKRHNSDTRERGRNDKYRRDARAAKRTRAKATSCASSSDEEKDGNAHDTEAQPAKKKKKKKRSDAEAAAYSDSDRGSDSADREMDVEVGSESQATPPTQRDADSELLQPSDETLGSLEAISDLVGELKKRLAAVEQATKPRA